METKIENPNFMFKNLKIIPAVYELFFLFFSIKVIGGVSYECIRLLITH